MSNQTIPNATLAKYQMGMSRQRLFSKAIKYSIKSGVSACFVRFPATANEVRQLTDLGYDVRISDSGSTHINWLNL